MHANETKLHFLIEPGVELSVNPRMYHRSTRSANYKLYVANGSEIKTYGEKQLKFNVGRVFNWKFRVVDVSRLIIGADFLRRYSLLVDLKNKKLVDSIIVLAALAQVFLSDKTGISTVLQN